MAYINIFPENPIYQDIERKFDNKHAGHTVQIISKEEIYKNYEIERFKKRWIKNVRKTKKTVS